MLPQILTIAKEINYIEGASKIFEALNEAILRESDIAYTALLYNNYTVALKVLENTLPQELRQPFDGATQFQLESMGQARQARVKAQGSWDNNERNIEIELEEAEDMALDEIAKTLHLVDPSHPYLLMTGSVRELGQLVGTAEWEDDEE